MELIKPHRGLQHSMKYWVRQLGDSLEAAEADYPPGSIGTAGELWAELRPRVTYVNDPDDRELIQSYQTLFYDNWHGTPGAGDCDCFALSAAAVGLVNRLRVEIVLAGRDRRNAVHIYNRINGVIFDLTRPQLGSVRFYPYIQAIHLKL